MSFTNLVVRKWDGDQWPEKRISLGCKDYGQAVAISPRYADLSVAEQDFEAIALRVNNHERLVKALDDLLGLIDNEGPDWDHEEQRQARALLSAMEAEKGGE